MAVEITSRELPDDEHTLKLYVINYVWRIGELKPSFSNFYGPRWYNKLPEDWVEFHDNAFNCIHAGRNRVPDNDIPRVTCNELVARVYVEDIDSPYAEIRARERAYSKLREVIERRANYFDDLIRAIDKLEVNDPCDLIKEIKGYGSRET